MGSGVRGPQDHSHFQHQLKHLGVLSTNLRFSNLLEALPELRKALRLTVKVYYRERIQIKISPGKRCMGGVQEGTKHRLPAVPSP